MAKSRNSAFFKQQIIMDQAFKIAKKARWEEKYGKDNLTVTEQLILDAQKRRAEKAKQPKKEEVRFAPNAYAADWVKRNS
jgi:hypothetical protein